MALVALCRRLSKKDQLQCKGKGMSLLHGALALIRANWRVGCHFILFRNTACVHIHFFFLPADALATVESAAWCCSVNFTFLQAKDWNGTGKCMF